jgi:hypothetical protein
VVKLADPSPETACPTAGENGAVTGAFLPSLLPHSSPAAASFKPCSAGARCLIHDWRTVHGEGDVFVQEEEVISLVDNVRRF